MAFGKLGALGRGFGSLGALGGAGESPFVPPAGARYWRPLSDGHAWTESFWSLTDSGPAGTLPPPTNAQIAAFSSNDNSNCIISSASVCLDVYFNAGFGWAGTLSGSSTLTISGIFRGSSTVNNTYTGTITFNATSTGKTITTGGMSLLSPITFNGTGGGWTNLDNLTTGPTNQISLTRGAWHTGGKTITAGIIHFSNTNTRTFNAVGSTFNATGFNNTLGTPISTWVGITSTGLTYDFTGTTIILSGRNAQFRSGGLTYWDIVMSGGDANGATEAIVCRNFTYTIANAGGFFNDLFNIPASMTGTGTFTINGGAPNLRVRLGAATTFTTSTLNFPTYNVANADWFNVTAVGVTITGISMGDFGGNTNVVFDTPKNVYWVNNGGLQSDAANHNALTSGGAPNINNYPLAQDTLIFDALSITLPGQTLTFDQWRAPAIDFTGVLNNPIWAWGVNPIYTGSLTLSAAMSVVGDGNFATFQNIAAGQIITLTTNGHTLPGQLLNQNFTALAGAEFQLGDDLSTQRITFRAGTFRDNGHAIIARDVIGRSGTVACSVIKTGNWTVNAVSGTFWSFATVTGLTWSDSGSITLAGVAPTGVRTFAGGGLVYNALNWADESSTFGLTVTGTSNLGNVSVAASASARTLTLPAGVTTTVSSLAANGLTGALLSIVSSSAGSPATISDASGTNTADFASIKDITAAGGATWNATNSTDVSGNTGWNFI